MYRFVSTSPTFGLYAKEPVTYIEKNGGSIEYVPDDKRHRLAEYFREQKGQRCDGVIVGVEKVGKEIINLLYASECKLIAKHGTGVDNIDIKAAKSKSIFVTNAPGANTDAVADLSIGLMLSLARKIPYANNIVKSGGWPQIIGYELRGKTLGLVGTGKVGKEVAKRAQYGFKMKVLAYDIFEDKEWTDNNIEYTSLENIFIEGDFVSIHIPLTKDSNGLVNSTLLHKMKPTAYIVNTSRGSIVDEADLYKCLKEGVIAGAALDVFHVEPVEKDNALLELDSFISTPHMAGYSYEALHETGMICAKNLIKVVKGEEPDFVV